MDTTQAHPISNAEAITEFSLTHAQQVAWFLYKFAPQSYIDKLAFAVRFSQQLDYECLDRVFQSLVKRHPSLRTAYIEKQGKVLQHVVDEASASVDFVSSTGWNEEKLQNQVLQSLQRPFDLASGSVVRLSVFSCTPTNHVILLAVHQIACDDRTLMLLVDELLKLYQARKNNIVIALPSVDSSYQEYVQRELNLLNSPEGEQLWYELKGRLDGELPTLNLPMSRPRPPVRTYRGALHKFCISPNIASKLQQFAQTEDVELSTILLAAFQVILHRYTATEELLVGFKTEQAKSRNFNCKIGNFNNLTVVRSSISSTLSFQELLSLTRSAVFDVIAHQDYPFPLLVRQLQLNSQLSHPPICQVGLTYQNLDKLETLSTLFNQTNSSLSYFEIPEQRVEFDLNWEILEAGESLTCFLHYNRDLLDADAIVRMAGQLQILLAEIVTSPKQQVTQLPILTDSEQHQLLIEWNATHRDYNLSRCLHELFETQVDLTPEAIAVSFEQQQLTYRELNEKANQLAHHLQKKGVKTEVLVGISVERSLQMVIGLLGILKAGGAYVPIDPESPQERIAYMLADSQVSLLLTQKKQVTQLPKSQAQIICLDADWEKISQEQTNNPASGVQPENLAYVIYTSGSTGKPKGAMNTHRGICNRLLWMQEAYQLTATDAVLQKTPFSFDVSVWEFFWTLLTGARLVIAKPGGHRDRSYLVELISQEQITTLHFVPSMLQVFLESRDLDKCQSLRRVICSGEALTLDLQEKFFQHLGCELHNLYGPTEAAIDVTFWRCQRQSHLRTVPIGRPIANTQIYILDPHLQPVPIGVTGELYIGGVGVARGYLNREELTAECFITNPFRQSDRLYKTGDLARYLSDGNIEYIGRIDHQVKIRGFRVELGEIENALSQHPQVREAVVIVRQDKPGDKQIVAYIVSTENLPSPSLLREFLRQKLPDYMVPAAFILLETLPLTSNGKLDRRALPSPSLSNFSESHNYIAPRNDIEQQLAEIWAQILDVHPVGVRDNFFELGGNSLLAIHLIAEIEEKFGKDLPLSELLTNPVIEDLAKILQTASNIFNNSPIVPIQPKGNKRPFFCVHPAGGHVFCYFNLARYLGREQPFYGLQAQGFNGEEEPLSRVEDMASLYVKAIQTVQPEGPYQIGGWSFGGVVAYEVAQQFYKQGHEVSLLAILDSYVPIVLDKQKEINNQYLVGVLSRVFGGMFGQDNLVTQDEIKHLSVDEQIDYIIDKARKVKIFPPTVERRKNRRILDVLVGTLKATYSYVRQPYPGKATIFRAREKHIMAPDPTLVWVELFSIMAAKEIEIIDVPGSHYSFVLEPHVQVLAERLKTCLV
ncbi:non-ribosomal peptide synthetase [Nostocales cyanobacterium HT-58-2]|nr:non-ribosomal peptide synthetase [Nostocales cyanobacterium HT-58-2]